VFFVYKVTNLITGKLYIGMTNNIETRWKQHNYSAKTHKYRSAFHSSIRKHGIENFNLEVIYCSHHRDDVRDKETMFIREYNTTESNFGYNLTDGGDGTSFTPEVRARISASVSIASMGHAVSPETRKKISAVHKGKILSAETRRKISEAKKGRTMSDEARAKMSASRMGRVISPEARAKSSVTQRGKIISPETRKKISAANTGKIPSLEARKKISEANNKIRVISTPEGIVVSHNLQQFCKDNNASYVGIRKSFKKQLANKTETPYKNLYYCLGVL